MIYLVAAIVWIVMGTIGAAARSYAFAALRNEETSMRSDYFVAALGPIGMINGLTNYAAAKAVKK